VSSSAIYPVRRRVKASDALSQRASGLFRSYHGGHGAYMSATNIFLSTDDSVYRTRPVRLRIQYNPTTTMATGTYARNRNVNVCLSYERDRAEKRERSGMSARGYLLLTPQENGTCRARCASKLLLVSLR